MVTRILAAAGLALGVSAAAAGKVAPDEAWVIVPQNRTQVIMPRHRPEPDARPLTLSAVTAGAVIDDQVATTTLVMTITNPTGRVREAQVLVPVPAGAAVRSFQLDSAGAEPTAKILPREEARRIYDSIVAASRDPGLLEFVGFNLMKSSVFPVPAAGSQTVRIVYEQLLTADSGGAGGGGTRVDYVLPRTESLQASGAEWGFSAEIRSKRAIASVYSPSHEITTERVAAGDVKVRVARSAGASGTLRLSYLLEKEKGADGLTASVLMYPDPEIGGGEGGYFMILGAFPRGAQEREHQQREVTIVLDRSGSMSGEKMDQARQGALQVVEGLGEGEWFNIVDYSDSIASFADHAVKKDAESLRRARGYLEALQSSGGTNIHDALVEALHSRPAEGTLPVVLFLTDGLPTVGKTREVDIREGVEKANRFQRRIFAFGVGLDVNSPLLSRLSDMTRGAPTFVLPGEDVEVKVSQVFRRLAGPVLSSPALVERNDGDPPGGGIKELLPRKLPDVFDGDQVLVLGQYTSQKPMKVTLTGNYLGKDRGFEVTIDPAAATTRNSFVPRLWATRMVAELVDQVRQNAPDGADPSKDPKTKELVDEIVRISTKWGVLTEYTAFLVQEPPRTPVALRELEERPAPAMAPASAAPAEALGSLSRRVLDRSGGKGVNQELNLKAAKEAYSVQGRQAYIGADLERVTSSGVQQVGDRTFLWRGNRWVDTRILKDEAAAPEMTVEFGSAEYAKLVDALAQEHLAGVLAMLGDVYLLQDGKRVLVKHAGE
jgi:Ca-activated chloride channel family protein